MRRQRKSRSVAGLGEGNEEEEIESTGGVEEVESNKLEDERLDKY